MKRDFKALKEARFGCEENNPDSFFFSSYKSHRLEFEQQYEKCQVVEAYQLNSAPNMPFHSASDWFQLLIHIHDKVKNLRQIEQLLGE